MMRRINDITILLLLLLVATGCCKHDDTIQDEVMIMLNATTSADGTKAMINSKDDFISNSYNGSGFGVFGYKSLKSESSSQAQVPQNLIFNNTEVKPSAASGNVTWSYTPIRFWDSNENAYYQFVAYWPHMQSAQDQNNTSAPWVENYNVIGQSTTGNMQITLHNIPNWQNAADASANDFMVATSNGKYKGSEQGVTHYVDGIVPFTFHHILAKLTIKAYYVGVKENHVGVYNITLGQAGNNLLSTSGTVNYTKPFGGSNNNPAFTDPTKGGSSQVLFNANATTPATPHTLLETAFYDEETPSNTPNCIHEDICTWLIVPTGGWNGLTLDISYTVGDETTPTQIPVSGINIGSSETTVQYSMNSGYEYVLTLKFDSSGGGIDVEMVYLKDWTSSNIGYEVYNW